MIAGIVAVGGSGPDARPWGRAAVTAGIGGFGPDAEGRGRAAVIG